jgi:hypothetical protein
MPSRELIVLSSASQVPTRHRNHNAYFLRWDEEGEHRKDRSPLGRSGREQRGR